MIHELDPHPIENMLTIEKGMPDVEFVGGWAEIKWLPRFPLRASTPVRIPHYTDDQRRWLRTRQAAGETCFLVLQVRNEWFVWDADGAQTVGHQTKEEMKQSAKAYWNHRPTPQEMSAALKSPQNPEG
jgi:hypothetical protein